MLSFELSTDEQDHASQVEMHSVIWFTPLRTLIGSVLDVMKNCPLPSSSPSLAAILIAAGLMLPHFHTEAQPDLRWLAHDRDQPQPTIVQPPTASTPDQAGRPPGDAIVLFDGSDLSQWAAMDGSPSRWITRDGYMECVRGSGYIRTLRNFGDCQLHIEWAAPARPEGDGQGRGNSGVFFGGTRYEIQVLDSYQNPTYADGSASAVYGQHAPLVNVSRPPGEWQSYDIVYTAPRFDGGGQLLSPARITVFHNGVLVQNNVELTGPTTWLERPPYQAHPEKLPISLQDHGNPVRFRNIWVRELGEPGRPEYTLADSVLDGYVGEYDRGRNDIVRVRRAPEGLLSMTMSGATFLMFAESPSKFFAKTTDVRSEFQTTEKEKVLVISVGEGAMRATKVK